MLGFRLDRESISSPPREEKQRSQELDSLASVFTLRFRKHGTLDSVELMGLKPRDFIACVLSIPILWLSGPCYIHVWWQRRWQKVTLTN